MNHLGSFDTGGANHRNFRQGNGFPGSTMETRYIRGYWENANANGKPPAPSGALIRKRMAQPVILNQAAKFCFDLGLANHLTE